MHNVIWLYYTNLTKWTVWTYKINKNIVLELVTENGESISKIEKIFKDNNIEYTPID